MGGELRVMTAAELAKATFATVLTQDDLEPRFDIHGEWYCIDEDCPVRTVRIHAVWHDGDRPEMPRFKCPSCSGRLKFHGHLKNIAMECGQ